MHTTNHPLSGVTVLDLGQIFAGGYAGFLLAMAGATVLKVEPPRGDVLRNRVTMRGGSGALPFEMLNSNKKGVTINLKSEEGRDVFFRLAQKADVVLENFSPGALEGLGLTWEKMREVNPRLIYAAVSGYGREGPYRDYPAMDLTIQAMAGVMAVTGFPDRPPVKAGPAVCDFMGGAHLYAAIVTALYQRERTGRGSFVEVALQDAVYPALASSLGLHFSGGGTNRTGNRHAGMGQSPYNVYPTSDGYVAIICVSEKQWHSLADAMGRPELKTDPNFSTMAARVANMDAVDEALTAWTRTVDKMTAFRRLIDADVPAAPVRDLGEVMEDAQMHARGMLVRNEHPEFGSMVLPNSPLHFPEQERPARKLSPKLGEHNYEVLGALLGMTPADVDRLAEKGAL